MKLCRSRRKKYIYNTFQQFETKRKNKHFRETKSNEKKAQKLTYKFAINKIKIKKRKKSKKYFRPNRPQSGLHAYSIFFCSLFKSAKKKKKNKRNKYCSDIVPNSFNIEQRIIHFNSIRFSSTCQLLN